MCSSILNIVFIVILCGGTLFALISTFTPQWRKLEAQIGNETEKVKINAGLIGSSAGSKIFGAVKNTVSGLGGVDETFKAKKGWEKAALGAMLLGLMCCGLAFVWSCVACFMCCCKSCLTPPLPIFAGLATICFIIGVAIFGIKSKDDIEKSLPTSYSAVVTKNDIGYSLWLGIFAILAMLADTIVGILLVKVSKISPI